MTTIDLCSSCARARGARTSNVHRYAATCLGIWRGSCDDCGIRGSSGDEADLTRFRLSEPASARVA